MSDATYQALLARALHPTTPLPEATASMGRVLLLARDRLRSSLSDSSPGAGWVASDDHARVVREVGRLRAALQQAEDRLRERDAAPSGDSRRVITLRYPATCADPECRAELPEGTRARWYGRGRVYCLSHKGEA